MAEIVNLRQARKKKARADKEARAAENRVAFGRTKAERDKLKAESELADRQLEGHRVSDPKVDSTFGIDPTLNSKNGASSKAENRVHFSARCAERDDETS